MKHSILVAYATKHGSTREVAEVIGETLRQQKLAVDVRSAGQVADVGTYDGVVLGGALYLGHLHRDARSFLARHRKGLGERPLAIFAIGPRTLEEADVEESRKQLEHDLAKAPGIDPFEIAIFGGVISPEKLRFPFKRMPASDARDWEAIDAWAEIVVAELVTAGAGDRAIVGHVV